MEEFQSIIYRYFSVVLLVTILSLVLSNCSVDTGRSNPFGPGEQKNFSSADPELGTWNQTPHGGSDEKSNSSPCGPTKRLQ